MKNIFTLAVLFSVFMGSAQFTYTYTGKPRFRILTTQNSTTLGIIEIELYPKIAPLHVRNFDSLVSQKFFDTVAFHRVVPGFVIQGGDPNSRHGPVNTWGFGQPSQPTVKAEFSLARHDRGALSAARKSGDINSATSQFFICVAPALQLDGQYSVYGRVTSGMNVADAIVSTPTVTGTQRPVDKIEMFVTYIGSNDTLPDMPVQVAPKNDSVNTTAQSVIFKWSPVSGAVFYHLDVALDSLFTDVVKSTDILTLSQVVNALLPDTTYYWRLSVNNGGHISTSPVWRFHTRELPVADETSIGETEQARRRVFPSPASSYVEFTTLADDRIELFDRDGRKLTTIHAKGEPVKVNVSNWARGLYFYTITHASGRQSGKLVLE